MTVATRGSLTAAPPGRDVAVRLTRRRLEMALGVIWLLDGALQLQPHMFTSAFFSDTLGMANMGLPGPLSRLIGVLTTMLAGHPAAWNAGFAVLQVGIGAGLLWARTARIARPVSIAWALSVWVIGEGLGGMFMPGVSALNGAPGAALLYVVAAVMLWPRRQDDGAAPAGAGLLGAAGARWCWAILWAGLTLLELGGANHAAVVPGAEVSNAGNGEPGWLSALNHHAGHLLAGRGAAFALTAGVVQLAIGLGVLRPGWRAARYALACGIALAVMYGVLGQDLGGLFTGRATDPGTASLLVLLALALWPRRHRNHPGTISPAG